MNNFFPVCKKDPSYLLLSFYSGSYGSVICADNDISHYEVKPRFVNIEKFNRNDLTTTYTHRVERDTENDVLEKLISIFFDKCNGDLDWFTLSAFMLNQEQKQIAEENPRCLPRIKAAIGNRRISTTFFSQNCFYSHFATSVFFREYVNYKMYGASFRSKSDVRCGPNAIEITDKMVNCEFLCLKCDLTNPERLKEFKGWGLALQKAEQNGYGFEFFYNIVQDWYAEKPIQFRFLGFECKEVDETYWKTLASLGKQIAHKWDHEIFEITRTNGDKCRIRKHIRGRDGMLTPTVCFYVGEPSKHIELFCEDWNFDLAFHDLLYC